MRCNENVKDKLINPVQFDLFGTITKLCIKILKIQIRKKLLGLLKINLDYKSSDVYFLIFQTLQVMLLY